MRDRLIELLIKGNNQPCGNGYPWEDNYCTGCEYENKKDCRVLQLADYLLENGVIVPPCKVGDKVYFVARNSGIPIGTIDEVEIVMIGRTQSGFCAKGKTVSVSDNTFDIIPEFKIDNYTFYSSREEAEKALKGGDGV